MFLDETGITTHLLRRYGRAPRGARVHDHAPCGRWQTSTFLAALRVTGLTAPGVFDGAIDGESVRAYIDQILVPTLHPGDIVIADNLGAHKVAGIQRALQATGATLWYLPPYSPDLNPIELCFGFCCNFGPATSGWTVFDNDWTGSPSCPATIRSNGVSSNQDSSSCVFGGTCGMP